MHYISSNYDGTTEPTYPFTFINSRFSIINNGTSPILIKHSTTEYDKGRSIPKCIETIDYDNKRIATLDLNPDGIIYRIYDESSSLLRSYTLNTVINSGTSSQTFNQLFNIHGTIAADYVVDNILGSMANDSVEIHSVPTTGQQYATIIFKYNDNYYSMFLFSYNTEFVQCIRNNNTKYVLLRGQTI